MTPDAEGRLFSFVLNLWFRWVDLPYLRVRLLRPYLPDGTPIPTPSEWKAIAEGAEQHQQEAEAMAHEETQRRREAEVASQEETQQRHQLESKLQQLYAELATLRGEKTE